MLIPVVARTHYAKVVYMYIVHSDIHYLSSSVACESDCSALTGDLQRRLDAGFYARCIYDHIGTVRMYLLKLFKNILHRGRNNGVGAHILCNAKSLFGCRAHNYLSHSHSLCREKHTKSY